MTDQAKRPNEKWLKNQGVAPHGVHTDKSVLERAMGRHEIAFNASHAYTSAQEEFDLFAILKEQLLAVGVGDEESLVSALESETSITELYHRMLQQDAELGAFVEALGSLIKTYTERKQRLAKKQDMVKALILMTLTRVDMKSIPSPYGTASRTIRAPKAEVIDKTLVPTEFWDVPEPVTITPPATINMEMLSAFAVERYAARGERIQKARAPFKEAIATAKAIPVEADRLKALAEIDAALKPAMDLIEDELPMPEGVKVAQEEHLTIRRK